MRRFTYALACFVAIGSGHTQVQAGARPSHRILIDMNIGSTNAQAGLTAAIRNLFKAFPGEQIRVVVVCHDEGVKLLLNSRSPMVDRILKLQRKGVTFEACNNTLRARHIQTDRLLKGTVVVDAAIAEIVRKQEAGFCYYKQG